MRRLFVVGALLVMMLGLRTLQAENLGYDPLTLATIGFVVLAAFALAELGGRLSLPRVTGYILAGIALGPFASGLMSTTVVDEMKMFNTLALGLIATTAGLELDLAGLRRLAKTLGATIGLKIVLGVLLVGGTIYGVEAGFGILGLESTTEIIAVALVFAALSLGTSPAIALAIISESKAKGRLSELVLGAAIVKDVVVVVCLAIAVAAGKALTGGGAIGMDVLAHVGEELGASVLGGAILGGLLIAYLRWIKAEMLLFVAAMVLVVAEVSAALHLELLLVFIVAGLVVRNFSHHEHDLLPALETVSLPIFIVFFTNAGASIDLGATLTVLPLAVAACVARALGYIVAGQVGGRAGDEAAPVRRLAWLGYLPQAGVTLGLIGLAATQLGSEIGTHVATLGMAIVAINLLAGPITLRIALRSAGEIPGDGTAAGVDHPTGAPAALGTLVDPVLVQALADTRTRAQALVDTWVRDHARPRVTEFIATCRGTLEDAPDPARLRRVLTRIAAATRPPPPTLTHELFVDLALICEELPIAHWVALEEHHRRVNPADTRWQGWAKRLASFGAFVTLRAGRRTRAIPVRLVARTRLEPHFSRLAGSAQSSLFRLEIQALMLLAQWGGGQATASETLCALDDLASTSVTQLHDTASDHLGEALNALVGTLETVGTPGHRAGSLRYSSVIPEIEQRLQDIDEDETAWEQRWAAGVETVSVSSAISRAHSRATKTLETRVVAPLSGAFETLIGAMRVLERRCSDLVSRLSDMENERILAEASALIPKPKLKKLRAAMGPLRRIPSSDRLLEAMMPEVPEKALLVASIAEMSTVERPAALALIEVATHERMHAHVLEAIVNPVETLVDGEREFLDSAERDIREAIELVGLLARAVSETDDRDEALARLTDGLQRVIKRALAVLKNSDDRGPKVLANVRRNLERGYELLAEQSDGAGRSRVNTQVLTKRPLRTRIRQRFLSTFAPVWHRTLVVLRGEAARYARLRRAREGAGGFDPADMRELLSERKKSREQDGGPGGYLVLFSESAIRDPMFHIAHRDELDSLIQTARVWLGDNSAGNAAAAVGGSGSGKSSMLAITRMKAGLRRSLLIERRVPGQRRSIIDALATRLACASTVSAIARMFTGERSMVVIDDLHTWIGVDDPGTIDDLQALIERTSKTVFWLVAIDTHAYQLIDEARSLFGWFAQVARLDRLSGPALARVLLTRHRPTGLALTYPMSGLTGAIDRLRRITPAKRYHEDLALHCRGNLRLAIGSWRVYSRETPEGVRMRPPAVEAIGLPFWPSLDSTCLAVLALLLRSGPRSAGEIAPWIGPDTPRALRTLITAGLAEQTDGEVFLLAAHRDDIDLALAEAGVLTRGGSL